MGKEIMTFGDIEVQKYKFCQSKSPVSINDVDISKIVVSNRILFAERGFKYFVGYEDGKKVTKLVNASKMSSYSRDFDKTKYISFLINYDELLKQYNEIWDKVNNVIKKGFDKAPSYNNKYIKIKIKSCQGRINRSFHDDKVAKEGSQ